MPDNTTTKFCQREDPGSIPTDLLCIKKIDSDKRRMILPSIIRPCSDSIIFLFDESYFLFIYFWLCMFFVRLIKSDEVGFFLHIHFRSY